MTVNARMSGSLASATGTITIDLVDSQTGKLVWRGWSDGTLDGIDAQAVIEARVDQAVTRIMEKLPPRF